MPLCTFLKLLPSLSALPDRGTASRRLTRKPLLPSTLLFSSNSGAVTSAANMLELLLVLLVLERLCSLLCAKVSCAHCCWTASGCGCNR
jgi:hypothetical protein